MGKTARWFRGLLGGTKKDNTTTSSVGDGSKPPTSTKKRWSFVKSFRDKDRCAPSHPTQLTEQQRRGSYREGAITSPYLDATVDPNKHAIAVAAATAAVAEAAVAAAQAAAAVVKLTSSGRCTSAYVSGVNGVRRDDDLAAVKIQAAFRGYLARRALHALKGLVKLQALVRGHIVRKGTAETMRCMQALVRVQARARAGRSYISEILPPNIKPSISHNPGPATPEKYERTVRTNSTRRDRGSTLKRNWSRPNSRDVHDMTRVHMGRNHLDHRMEEQWDYRKEIRVKTGPTDDEKSDKILEIDPGKPHFNTKGWNALQLSQSFTTVDSPSKDSTTAQLSTSSTSSGEVQSVNPCRSQLEIGDEAFSTAQNSPQFYSASSMGGSVKRGPFTPTTSDCSRSFLSGYSDHPNYMANTESSRAKVRSQSAPKQRLEFEKCSSTKRHSYGAGDARSSAQRASAALHANFASKAYPGSGRLDRLGMPIRSETVGYSGGYHTRY